MPKKEGRSLDYETACSEIKVLHAAIIEFDVGVCGFVYVS